MNAAETGLQMRTSRGSCSSGTPQDRRRHAVFHDVHPGLQGRP